jgi:hypothetical protein
MGIGLVVLVCVRFRELGSLVIARGAADAHAVDTRYQPKASGSDAADVVTIIKNDEPAARVDRDVFTGVKPDLLGRVRDDTPWIRNDEIDAWWNIWSVLKQTDARALARASAGKVGFAELFQQPKAFRGKAVTVRGSARQAIYMTAGENAEGIEGYFRLVIWPENGPAEPIFLYALELPDGFPTGEEIGAEIEATGIFFKRMVYPTEHNQELRRAPAIMSRTIDWRQPVEASSPHDNAPVQMLLALTALGVVVLVGVLAWTSRSRVYPRAHDKSAAPKIQEHEVVEVRDALRKLAESEQ